MCEPYYTHREYLKEELQKLVGKKNVKCLEFGSGYGSGEIFKEFVNDDFKVESFEDDASWYNNCKNTYQSKNYNFNLVNWGKLDYNDFNEYYDLVFVDQCLWYERVRTVEMLKNKANVIIVHDFDCPNKQGMGYIDNCPNIYATDETTFWGNSFSKYFYLEGKIELMPPTLIMRKKNG